MDGTGHAVITLSLLNVIFDSFVQLNNLFFVEVFDESLIIATNSEKSSQLVQWLLLHYAQNFIQVPQVIFPCLLVYESKKIIVRISLRQEHWLDQVSMLALE